LTCIFGKEDDAGVTDLSNPFQSSEASDADPVADADPAADAGQTEPERPYTPAEGLPVEAPYGYTIDRKSGVRRPRKRAGRGVRVVKAEESAQAGAPKAEREPDKVPGKVKPPEPRASRGRPPRARIESEPLPAFRAGPIAKGVNRLYRKGGRILKVWDAEIGQALIECTRRDVDPDTGEPDPEDTTVGEAWEEIAKVNPRIRRVLLKLIEGGAWGALLMAHAPILVAILTKESVLRRLPLARLMTAFMSDDDTETGAGGEPSLGGLFASLTPEDMAQAMAAFGQFMPDAPTPKPDRPFTAQRQPMPSRQAVYEDLGDWPGHVSGAEHAGQDSDAPA
jgi:hypothetical protein